MIARPLQQPLLFVMSFRQSVTRWQRSGMLDREILLLNSLIDQGLYSKIWIFSYDARDIDLLATLRAQGQINAGIDVIVPRRRSGSTPNGLLSLAYSLSAPLFVRRYLGRQFVIRTNQISGAWVAILLKLVFRQPLVLRCGYSLSKRFTLQGKGIKARLAAAIEYIGVKLCDVCFVSSADVQQYFARWISDGKVILTPTFVDTNVFTQRPRLAFEEPMLYVGRLEPLKNIEALLEACRNLDQSLHVYGEGSHREHLERFAKAIGAHATFCGVVGNNELATVHQRHSIYVLPSHFDAMPKTLIEAMASGLICVATPTVGACELIKNGKTGYLAAGFSVDDVTRTIRQALLDKNEEIGRNARQHILNNNSREGFVRREIDIVRSIVSKQAIRHSMRQPEATM
jgi:glycosyltransferase involved in cell wall biosynthesis